MQRFVWKKFSPRTLNLRQQHARYFSDLPSSAPNDVYVAELRGSHKDLDGVTNQNFAEYTSLFTAYLRAEESKRDDAIINDPYAGVLAGSAGVSVLSFFEKWAQQSTLHNYMALRTRAIDDALAGRDPSIHQVVIAGAGLDTRAYRLETLSSTNLFEIDWSKAMMDRKQRVLEDTAQAKLKAKSRQVLIANLEEDGWDQRLVSQGYNPDEPTFWVLEGLMFYLRQDSNIRLLAAIDNLSPPRSQIWADLCGEALSKGAARPEGFKYGEDDPHQGVFSSIPWAIDYLPLEKRRVLFGRQWEPMVWSLDPEGRSDALPAPWFFISATKP